jgi:MscS family membrane protein
VGDLIKVGNIEGNVERIGFRSTRIRTLDKTFVTVPNKKLIDSELDNLSLRELRRVKFDLGIKYSSQKEKIETIILRIKETIIKHNDTTEESFVYLYAFKDYSISIRVIFFISTADWQIYMEVREFINYQIMLILEEEGCEFAFLTTTLDLSNSSESKPEILSS